METITITFGDQAENHVGMQKLGNISKEGFTKNDLFECVEYLKNNYPKIKYELIELHKNVDIPTSFVAIKFSDAYILIIKNGINGLLGDESADSSADELFKEQKNLEWDKKAKMYGRVVNKNARDNLCYADYDQEPDYENGKGRIISWNSIPITKKVKDILPSLVKEKAENLVGEGNYYYNVKKCGIGYHGDSERLKVVAVRLGATMPIQYQWFLMNKSIGSPIRIELNHGDIYIMSQKATGNDWKHKKIPTIRHAAGSEKYLQCQK